MEWYVTSWKSADDPSRGNVARPPRGIRWRFFLWFRVYLFFWIKESPPSIMVTRKPNWSFRDSKAWDWLRKGKVLAPLVRPT
jgi:hypothetical protein